MRRQLFGMVIAALVAAVAMPVVAQPAEATAYRYWSYWHETGSGWEFSKIGATGAHPADGTVEGWRFAVSPGTASAPAPRLSSSTAFSSVCGSTAAQSGKKRVALVVDFGVGSHAPSGESPPDDALRGSCVVIRSAATGWDILVAAGYAIRSESGLVCGLSGYPSRGCGEVVANATAAPPTPDKKPTADATSKSASNAGNGASGTNGAGGGASKGARVPTASSTATASAGADASASPSASATAASQGAIPSAAALDSSSALPSLVSGAPVADTSGTSSNPLRSGLAVLLVAVIAGAAVIRNRAIRRAGRSA